MKTTTQILETLNIADTTLQGLLRIWQAEEDPEKKSRTKDAITVIVEMHERNSFLARFILKDFDTWNKVLTKDESGSAKAHKREFYEPYLIEVLRAHNGKLEPIQAIAEVLHRVINDLTLADFTVTESKRLRFDTNIRFCANALKRRGVLSLAKEAKNKYWMLKSEEATTLPEMG